MSKRKHPEGDAEKETGQRRKKTRTQERPLPTVEASHLSTHDANGAPSSNGVTGNLQHKTETRKERKLARRAERKQEKASENAIVDDDHKRHSGRENGHEQSVIPLDKAERKRKKRLLKEALKANLPKEDTSKGNRRRTGQSSVKKRRGKQTWSIGDAVGGQMLDLDPLFSMDEEYLLLAYDNSIHVYSTATSLMVRSFRVGSSAGRISSFAFSSTNPTHLYISTELGVIEVWDWLECEKKHQWFTNCHIRSLKSENVATPESPSELIYTLSRKGKGPWTIDAHRLLFRTEAGKNQMVTLHKSAAEFTAFKVIEQGKCIIATCGASLVLGTTDRPDSSPFKDLSYTWREIECPEWISTFDVRLNQNEKGGKAKRQKSGSGGIIDIVVGGLKGTIHLFHDLQNKLIKKERQSGTNTTIDLSSRKHHWHRNAVLTCKWSLDGRFIVESCCAETNVVGNYVISGGLETVLLLWQLETGNQTTLPHLGAPLESIVVSPSGTRYAIRLADNSAMIISTSELSPIFNVPGIQLPSAKELAVQLPFIPTVDTPTLDAISPKKLRLPSINGPRGLMCAVPSVTTSRIISGASQNSCYLQMFDIGSARQISRQAMTRTKVTDLNIGPESNTIQEPDVRLMQISSDGKWLATVDEWMPPIRDLEPLTFDKTKASEEQNMRKEIFLRFWLWDENAKTWELVSRIDKPHVQQAGRPHGSARILHLASDPSLNGFATIGEDGTVCIWSSSTRRRYGSAVRKKGDKDLVDWNCHLTIPLDVGLSAWEILKGARLVYSPDGSVLAVGCYSSSLSTLHLIDTYEGSLTPNSFMPLDGPVLGLEFIDKYLITLSTRLHVWDLVSSKLHYGFSLDTNSFSLHERSNFAHLTADHNRNTFAITLLTRDHPEKSGERPPKLQSQLMIFDPKSPVPVFTRRLEKPTTQLLPLWERAGYLIIDTAAEIQPVTPNVSSRKKMILPTPPASEPETAPAHLPTKAPKGIANLYGSNRPPSRTPTPQEGDEEGGVLTLLSASSKKGARKDFPFNDLEVEEDDAVVVPPQKLAEVFESGNGSGSAFALPPVMELFERVAGLFAGRATRE